LLSRIGAGFGGLSHQADGLMVECRPLLLNHFPYDAVVYFGVSMDQNVTEGNDALVFAELCRDRRVQPGKLGKRFADDGERPLDCIRSIGSC
jgi:hypothetical protein